MKLSKAMQQALWECKKNTIATYLNMRYRPDAGAQTLQALYRRGLTTYHNIVTEAGEQVLRELEDDYDSAVTNMINSMRYSRDRGHYYSDDLDRVSAPIYAMLERSPIVDQRHKDVNSTFNTWQVSFSVIGYRDIIVTHAYIRINVTLKHPEHFTALQQAIELAQTIQTYLQLEVEQNAPKPEAYGLIGHA